VLLVYVISDASTELPRKDSDRELTNSDIANSAGQFDGCEAEEFNARWIDRTHIELSVLYAHPSQ
jgi:hypothetical protein